MNRGEPEISIFYNIRGLVIIRSKTSICLADMPRMGVFLQTNNDQKKHCGSLTLQLASKKSVTLNEKYAIFLMIYIFSADITASFSHKILLKIS